MPGDVDTLIMLAKFYLHMEINIHEVSRGGGGGGTQIYSGGYVRHRFTKVVSFVNT